MTVVTVGRFNDLILKTARIAGVAGLFVQALLPQPAASEGWPSKPVTIIVPYGPGAVNDLYARTLANILSKKFNKPFIVENRPGAGSYIGTHAVTNAAPDGYTLLENSMTVTSLNGIGDIVFDPEKELSAVGMLARSPYAMLVSSSTEATTVKDFIEYAKSHPDKTFFGVSGVGTLLYMLHEKFNIVAGTTIKPVVYHGGAPMIIDMAAGRLHLIFGSVNSAIGPIKSDQIRVLAYTGPGATKDSPPAPIMKDLGYDFESTAWFGIFGPPNMPAALKTTINAAINEAMQTPQAVDVLSKAGASPWPITTSEFDAVVKKEIKDFNDLSALTGVKPQ